MMKWTHPYGSTTANRTAGALPRAAGKFVFVLVILFGISGVAVAQDLDCSALLAELAHDWGPDTDPDTVFEGYMPRNPDIFSGVGARVQMYIPNYWQRHPHPEAPRDTPEVIAEAIRKTTEQLNPYLRPMPICVVLSPSIAGQATEDWDWHTLADASRLGDACTVVINLPGALPVDVDSGFRVGRQSASGRIGGSSPLAARSLDEAPRGVARNERWTSAVVRCGHPTAAWPRVGSAPSP